MYWAASGALDFSFGSGQVRKKSFLGMLTQMDNSPPPSHQLSSPVALGNGIIGRCCSFSVTWTLREQTGARLHSAFAARCFEEGQEMNGVVASSEMALLPPLNPSNGPASSRFAAGRP
ncbi:hypothetical protein SRHO_G00222320 [Serrasalmus rhombeus]